MKVDVDVKEMLLSNISHVQYSRKNCQLCTCSIRFTFLPDMSSFRLDLFSTFRGVHTLIFTCVPYIVIGLHEELANFYKEKRSVAFVISHLFTSLMVLSLIGLVTTQILACENQIIRRLEILLRTIVTA